MCGVSFVKMDLLNGGDTSQSESPFFYWTMLIKYDVCHHSERLRFQGQPSRVIITQKTLCAQICEVLPKEQYI